MQLDKIHHEVWFREDGLQHATGKFQLIPPQVSDNNKVIGTWYISFRGEEEGEGKRKPEWNTLLMSTTLKWYSV